MLIGSYWPPFKAQWAFNLGPKSSPSVGWGRLCFGLCGLCGGLTWSRGNLGEANGKPNFPSFSFFCGRPPSQNRTRERARKAEAQGHICTRYSLDPSILFAPDSLEVNRGAVSFVGEKHRGWLVWNYECVRQLRDTGVVSLVKGTPYIPIS